jgi:hypothetical protein
MMAANIPDATNQRPVDLDPKLVNSIGLHHSLATAIADLVDNSLDAVAGTIRVRLLLDGTAPVGVQVIDDGNGMGTTAIDKAMTYAGTRAYRTADLGHFGVGLKAASLSQADTILIYSRAYGSTPVGRKLLRSRTGGPPTVGTIDAGVAAEHLDEIDIDTPLETGTVVEWRDVRVFPTTTDDDERNRWLEQAIREIRAHLGLVLHRILPDRGPEVAVDTFDLATGTAGVTREVTPVDPFGYRRSGIPGYPQDLEITLPDGSEPVTARAHVWPSHSQDPGFKINGDPGVNYQGCFVYRRNRLLQIGGWCGIFSDRPAWELARLEVDLTETAALHVTINPEKSGLEFSADLRRALENAVCVDTGDSVRHYLTLAAGEEKRSRSRTRRPISAVEPRLGLPSEVLDAYREAVEFANFEPVDIRWRILGNDQIFSINFNHRTIELNTRYREAIVGRRSLDPDDAPVFKVLVHLLTEKFFAGFHLGPRDKREIKAWHEVLFAAVKAQMAQQPPEQT